MLEMNALGSQIRVLLAEVPGLIAAVARQAILAQPDMTIVGDSQCAEDIGSLIGNGKFDVVLTSVDNLYLPIFYRRLVLEHPHIPVLAISADGRRLEVYDCKFVRGVSPTQLVDIIREVGPHAGHSAAH